MGLKLSMLQKRLNLNIHIMLTCEQHQYENKQAWKQQQGDSLVDRYKPYLLSEHHDFSRYLPLGMSFLKVL